MIGGASTDGAYQCVDSKDGTDVDAGVDVAATVEGVENDAVLALVASFNDDRVLELFGNENGRLARRPEGIDHDVIGEDIQLLLFFPLNVGFSRETDAGTGGMRTRI